MTHIDDVHTDLLSGKFDDYREIFTNKISSIFKLSTREIFFILDLDAIPTTIEAIGQLNNMKAVFRENKPAFLMTEEVFGNLSPLCFQIKKHIREVFDEFKE